MCVEADDYAWYAEQYDFSTESRAVCSNCDGVLHKYIISRDDNSEKGSFSFASNKCKSNYNTTLASIHNAADMTEARLLSRTRNHLYLFYLYHIQDLVILQLFHTKQLIVKHGLV